MRYQILSAETVETLVARVNEALADGWSVGSGFLYVPPKSFKDNACFYQAMTKENVSAEVVDTLIHLVKDESKTPKPPEAKSSQKSSRK